MRADDPRHGTNAGHRAHYQPDGDKSPCGPCKEAHAAYHRRRRARLYLGRTERLTVGNFGAIRRVRALQAIGWDLASIGRAMGYENDDAQEVRVRVWNIIGRHEKVRLDVFRRLCEAYERLSGTPGPSQRTRKLAARKGWPPPLAWDDIDDPEEQPYSARIDGRLTHVVEDFDWLVSQGESPEQAAARLGVKVSSVQDMRLRMQRRQEVA